MRGCIKFSDGKVAWFTEDDYHEVLAKLTDTQREQLVTLLRNRLGKRNPLPVDVDSDVYESWYEDTHRKVGGGGGQESVKVKKTGGKKLSVRDWHSKSDSDRNIIWLRNMGFRKTWDKDLGYQYIHIGIVLDLSLLSLSHDEFKIRVGGLFNGTGQVQQENKET